MLRVGGGWRRGRRLAERADGRSGARGLAVLLALVVLALPAAAPVAGAAERLVAVSGEGLKPVTTAEGRPKFDIPADSPLARNEHPRLLLTAADIERLKERLADPRIAREFEVIRKRSLGSRPSNLERALVYALTGDKQFLEAIKNSSSFKRPTWSWGWSATIDLIWNDLSEGERRELSDAVVKSIAKGGSEYWRPTLHMVSVFYEGGKGPNDPVFLARMKRDFDQTLVNWTDKLNRWAAGRGGSNMGHGYNWEHAYWEPFVAAICWTHATGEDYLSRAEFAKYECPFYWYHFIPKLEPLCVEHIGVTRSCADRGALSVGLLGWLAITREGDGLGPVWMDMLRSQEPSWGKDRDALGRLLWWEPDQPSIDYGTLPTTRIFPTSGHVIMRSDWTEDCTFATFRCGRFGEIDGTWGRNNADNLSFTIRKGGPLAIDSGPVHLQNVQVLNFLAKEYNSMAPIYEYGRQTIAHNSITVGGAEYVHLDWRKKPTGNVVRRGGQSVPQAKEWWAKWGFDGPQKDFMEGRITAYRTHPLYDYTLGDARFSYNPDDVQEITRQFIYLKPDVFVVYDRIVVSDPAKRPCWMLHSLREPKATGEERALSPEEIGPQFLDDGKEKSPHPQPGGHFRMEGDGFWVESGSPGEKGGGWLKVQTLVPAEQDAERKKVGGRGHDFEVAGVQYGLTDEGYKKADDPYAVLSTIGLLGWRVELRHREPAEVVEFLHVLQAGTGRRAVVKKATLQSTRETHTVTVVQGGRTFEVTLRRTGKRGGSIKVIEAAGGAPPYEAALAETVEDYWRYYRDDPNFRLWVTDPRYRVVIEPTDEDRALAE